MTLEVISEHACFGGTVGFYRHRSTVNACDMRFAVFQPPQAASGPVPVLTWLAGLTCTEETFMIKAGAQRVAAELGLMIVAPDTSPRGEDVPDDPDGAWDFGLAAGFYLNATEEPWRRNYRMYDYIVHELQQLVFDEFPGDRSRQGMFGHSMGGHGALTIGLKHPEIYGSVSAFAPISNPMDCPWGRKAFGNYLGSDPASWRSWDATELVRSLPRLPRHPILVDQGLADQFLERELKPERFEAACAEGGVALEFRRHAGYDHGYYFISTFIEDHLRRHAAQLAA
ncbi:MAG: S-formylglutathione hydrolase [Gammaproteobacteria bacterium]|nr:S-formylglutathione hydrolase [Gammaproteobacteria bacterium]MDH4253448.1 S-formylglutathione hydrolase [Gammaproteobacteria bacterium]MDH5309190.1 S-formylglutathione hydrolase [Gammaproteobacteria bacterium]